MIGLRHVWEAQNHNRPSCRLIRATQSLAPEQGFVTGGALSLEQSVLGRISIDMWSGVFALGVGLTAPWSVLPLPSLSYWF